MTFAFLESTCIPLISCNSRDLNFATATNICDCVFLMTERDRPTIRFEYYVSGQCAVSKELIVIVTYITQDHK
jgi:hypothetical protein